MSQLHKNIVDLYSLLHGQVIYTNNNSVSFQGSQKQVEFFKAWDCISDYYSKNKKQELTFLEVGAWKGLWGLAFYEFCKLNNIKGKYVTVTWISHDAEPNKCLHNTIQHLNSNGLEAVLIDGDSTDSQTVDQVKNAMANYDIVFIDASHEYDYVMKDIKNYAPMAKDILAFHDIRSKDAGVYKAIIDSKVVLNEEIVDSEDTMGIGIKYIKP